MAMSRIYVSETGEVREWAPPPGRLNNRMREVRYQGHSFPLPAFPLPAGAVLEEPFETIDFEPVAGEWEETALRKLLAERDELRVRLAELFDVADKMWHGSPLWQSEVSAGFCALRGWILDQPWFRDWERR